MTGVKIKTRDSMGRIPQKWCIESALEESKKYSTKKDFRTKSNTAYQYLAKHKQLHRINLPGKRHRLCLFDIFCAMKKSSDWGDFRKNYPKEYTAFHKRKGAIEKSAYAHLGISKTALRWTASKIKDEAMKYEFRSDFSKLSSGAYNAANKMGILNDVCSHMKSKQSDFDCVYFWVAKKRRGMSLIKVGVTSERLGKTRIDFVQKKSGMKSSMVVLKRTNNALSIESYLKNIGEPANLTGFSGCTEFFWVNDDQLKKVEEVISNETIE